MPHSKKPKLTHDDAASAASISSDELAMIFGHFGPVEILPLRRVCKKWNEAAKNTVPLVAFQVNDEKSHHTMKTMSSALPKLQQLELGRLKYDYSNQIDHRYANGEDPNEEDQSHRFGNNIIVTHEIGMISNFTKLRVLKLYFTQLNGSYPHLFNFPLLEHFSLQRCHNLKWDLGMLAGFPLLKELDCCSGARLTGNINSLRVLKDTLEKVVLECCPHVEGKFMDLDFPHLKILDLHCNMDFITGDIRDIGEASFPKLEKLLLPETVYGGYRSKIMRISDAKDLIAAIYSIKKQRHRHPSLFEDFNWNLSESSLGSYQNEFDFGPRPRFSFCIVRAGSRLGWRWEQMFDYTPDYRFEVNWLDPLPVKGSSEYQSYIEELQKIESYMDRFPFFKGYHEPPTEAVYNRLARQYRPSQEEMHLLENL